MKLSVRIQLSDQVDLFNLFFFNFSFFWRPNFDEINNDVDNNNWINIPTKDAMRLKENNKPKEWDNDQLPVV